jgi:GntR family transcriptional regulator
MSETPTEILNPQSPLPLYHQLAELLAARIRAGDYPPGTRIPSEHQLAAAFAIGRPTARQAIDVLVRKGLVTRRRGSRTYVRESRQEVDLFSLDGTSAAFDRKGLAVTSRIIAPLALKTVGNSGENPFAGEKAYFLERLTCVEAAPVLIETLFLHPGLFAGLADLDLEGRSLSAIAEERYFLRPNGGRQSFQITYLDAGRARHLQVTPETPVLAVRRLLHFPQAQNGVFAELYCRTDQFVFSQNIGGPGDA